MFSGLAYPCDDKTLNESANNRIEIAWESDQINATSQTPMHDIENFDENDLAYSQFEVVDALAHDFLARHRNGERPSIDEYARRHPTLAEQIQNVFPSVLSLEQVKVGQRGVVNKQATLAGREIKRLGDFEILREIGRGGMGIVFAARQESLDRIVAIKVLPRQSLMDDDDLHRFHREARLAAAMHHSNIVPIYGTGDFDGSHYLVMQLVEGQSLDRHLVEIDKPMKASVVADLGVQISDAIAYAHDNGVLHRDIKPANIILQPDGVAQISDFGLATSTDDDRTKSRTLSGSLRYLAPERLKGISDQRSDVYSIGLTLFEMLIGEPAFQQNDTNELLHALVNPTPLSIAKSRSDVPLDLETVVLKAMASDPKLRYQTAGDLRDDLRRFIANEPIVARKATSLQRLGLWCRREPKSAIAAATAIAALLLISVVASLAYFLTANANRQTTAALKRSESIVKSSVETLDNIVDIVSLESSSDGIDFWESDVLQVDHSFVDPTTLASPYAAEILERLRPMYEELLRQSPTNSAILMRMVGASVQHARILAQLGESEQASETIQRGIELLEDASVIAKIPELKKQIWLARLANEQGNYINQGFNSTDADECFKRALMFAQQLPESDPDAQVEIVRARIGFGTNHPRGRRGPRGFDLQRKQRQLSLKKAIQILDQLQLKPDNATEEESAGHGLDTAGAEVLRARSYLGLASLSNDGDERLQQASEAVDILEAYLNEHPDNSFVRMELVKALGALGHGSGSPGGPPGKQRSGRPVPSENRVLNRGDTLSISIEGITDDDTDLSQDGSDKNIDGEGLGGSPFPIGDDGYVSLPQIAPIRLEGLTVDDAKAKIVKAYAQDKLDVSQDDKQISVSLLQRPSITQYRQNLKPQLEKALEVLRPLREEYPSTPSFMMSEVRIRQRLASTSSRRGRLNDAKRQFEIAIDLQTNLIETMPDTLVQRCRRALLYYSLAEVLRDLRQPANAEAAMESARQDLASVKKEDGKHPMVRRVQQTLSGKARPQR